MRTRAAEPLPADLAQTLERAGPRLGSIASRVFFYTSTGSTNDVASALALAGAEEGVVVIADEQTSGRGRRGRAWYSPPGAGLYTSVILSPAAARTDPARALSLLTLAAGVAVAEGIDAATGLTTTIKWPNDVLIGRRKVCGILAEAVPTPASIGAAGRKAAVPTVVLGYGINVSRASYPPDIADRATSLDLELGRPVDRAIVCAETLSAIARRYGDLLDGRFDAILDAWRRRAPESSGVRVAWTAPDGRREGTTSGLDHDGALLVRVGGKLERLIAGEISELRS